MGFGFPCCGGKTQEIIDLFDLFGDELVWDFQAELGINVVEFFTLERSWDQFFAFLRQLPDHSRFRVKQLTDPELAQQYYAQFSDEDIKAQDEKSKDGTYEPPLLGYTPELAKMDQLLDAINLLSHLVATALSSKKNGPKFEPEKRPKTAFEKEFRRRLLEAGKKDAQDLAANFGF